MVARVRTDSRTARWRPVYIELTPEQLIAALREASRDAEADVRRIDEAQRGHWDPYYGE